MLDNTETTTDTSDSADELYTPVEEVENYTCTTPRKKRKVMEHMYNNASMPKEYQHVRCSIRKVRPEYYEVVDKLTYVTLPEKKNCRSVGKYIVIHAPNIAHNKM